MTYTNDRLIENICLKEYRRQKAVFLAGRISKASRSPGFIWGFAIEGFSQQFKKEASITRNEIREEYPEHPEPTIDWKHLIKYFMKEPYKKKESK